MTNLAFNPFRRSPYQIVQNQLPTVEGHWLGSNRERFAPHGPLEGLGQGFIEIADEAVDLVLEVLGRGEGTAAQDLAGENGEPEFDLVEPGGMLRGEMEADAVIGIA